MRYPDGEYWIHDGTVTYCDGDIGRDNHEAVVIDHVQRDIIERVGDIRRTYGGWFGDDSEGVDWDGWKGAKERELLAEKYGEDADRHEDEGESLLVAAAHAAGVTDEAWETAEMQNDARDYGMEHLKWKAVRGTNVDTWTLTPDDMGDIASGLDEILNGEGGYDEEDGDEYDEDEGTAAGEEIEWTIEVHSTHRTYEMTISQLEEGSKGQGPRASASTSARDIASQQSAAAKSVRQMDIDRLHPYYQNRTFPIGDSAFGFPTFREWLRGR